MNLAIERILDCIGDMDEMFLEETEALSLSCFRRIKRERMMRYGAAGLAVSVGMAVAYLVIKQKKVS